eukprot:scaffold2148_cov137-Isochrysis_galbana.AAC.2
MGEVATTTSRSPSVSTYFCTDCATDCAVNTHTCRGSHRTPPVDVPAAVVESPVGVRWGARDTVGARGAARTERRARKAMEAAGVRAVVHGAVALHGVNAHGTEDERTRRERLGHERRALGQGSLWQQQVRLRVDPPGLAGRLDHGCQRGDEQRRSSLGAAHERLPLAVCPGARGGGDQEAGHRCGNWHRQPRDVHSPRQWRAHASRVDALRGAAQALLREEERRRSDEVQLHVGESVPGGAERARQEGVDRKREQPREQLQREQSAQPPRQASHRTLPRLLAASALPACSLLLIGGGGGWATCYDAAPSGAHASSIGKHAQILTAYDGCDMADEAALAVENFPTVAALGFGFFELGLVEGLNVLVAEIGSQAAVTLGPQKQAQLRFPRLDFSRKRKRAPRAANEPRHERYRGGRGGLRARHREHQRLGGLRQCWGGRCFPICGLAARSKVGGPLLPCSPICGLAAKRQSGPEVVASAAVGNMNMPVATAEEAAGDVANEATAVGWRP